MPTQLLPVGPPVVITQNIAYALPSKLCQVSTSAACETSVDSSTWVAFTSGTETSALFIRCPGANATVVCKAAVRSVSSGSGALPTAPIGQVLISQGNGVAPKFSPEFTLFDPSVNLVDQRRWNFKIGTDGVNIRMQNDAGINASPWIQVDPYSGGISSIFGGIGAINSTVAGKALSFASNVLSAVGSVANTIGNLANITDSTVNTVGSTVVGGGTFNVLARWNGTVWKVIAIG